MTSKKKQLTYFEPQYIAQVLVGLYLLGAAYYKSRYVFFGAALKPIQEVIDMWMERGWTLAPYGMLLSYVRDYANVLAATIIVLQILCALLLIHGRYLRSAAVILFLVQLSILLGVWNDPSLFVFVSLSLWLSLYYFFQGSLTKTLWLALTTALVFLFLIELKTRYSVGDPWISSATWQRTYFAQNIMSVSPLMKNFVLWVTQGTIGAFLWASQWWVQLLLTIGMWSRWRLQCGIALLLLLTGRTLIWLSSFGVAGILWVLVLYTWVIEEGLVRRRSAAPLRTALRESIVRLL